MVGYPVVDPERRGPRKVVEVAVALTEAFRHLRKAAIHRVVDRQRRVVDAKPQHAAHSVGQPRAHLCHEGETGLLFGYRTFVHIFHRILCPRERRIAHGRVPVAGARLLAHVHRSAVKMVAHHFLKVSDAEFLRRLHVEWKRVAFHLCHPRQIAVHTVGKAVEVSPHAAVASAIRQIVADSVCLAEAEVLVFALEPAFAACILDYVFGVEAVLLVAKRDAVYARLVGVAADAGVGDADGCPHGAFLIHAFRHHLEHPHFVGVGYRERLSAAVVAVALHERRHHADCLAGGARALQRDVDKRAVVHYGGGVCKLGAAIECGLGYCQLMLVHVAHGGIRVLHLLYLSEIFMCVPLLDVEHFAFLMVGGGLTVELAVEHVGIGVVGNHCRAVGCSVFSCYQAGACKCRLHARKYQGER